MVQRVLEVEMEQNTRMLDFLSSFPFFSYSSFLILFHNSSFRFIMPINEAKLAALQAKSARIGGKGTARRKKKVVHRTATSDDKKLQSTLKKLGTD